MSGDMISVSELQAAQPSLWSSASNDWNALLQLTRETSVTIRDRGQAKINDNWPDAVGAKAAKKFSDLANAFDIASYTFSSVSMILDGLAEAVQLAQQTLGEAIHQAQSFGLTVEDGGRVSIVESGMAGIVGDEHLPRVQDLVLEALAAVTLADQKAADEFSKLAQQTSATDPGDTLETVVQEASNAELEMFTSDVIPTEDTPDNVAAWWQTLTPQQRIALENAAPTRLYNLDGIPQDVKDKLAGPGRFNRMTFVQFAEDNWNSDSGDLGNVIQVDSCTSFTSTAMYESGVPTSHDWFGSPTPSAIGYFQAKLSSPTWGAAQNFHDFLTSHGGHELPAAQAKPGDVIFFWSETPGHIHHTAIITAVLPNGDIRYTQHSDPALNYSTDARAQQIVDVSGPTRLIVVRPNDNGY